LMSTTRRTKQKEAILEVLRGTDSHPTAAWIYERVKQKLPHISLGTVYRDLKMLARNGDILEIDFGSDPSRYDANTGNHYHFRCLRCSNIYDIDEAVDMEMDKRVARKTGFDVMYHCLEFHGFCRQCQQGFHPVEDTAPHSLKAAATSRTK
jgi:Fur family peroxide stress response transcriptional regulator